MRKWIALFICLLLFSTATFVADGSPQKKDLTKAPESEKKVEKGNPAEAKPARQMIENIKKYWNAFNTNDLDSVMKCFSDDAVYQPGDGKTHKGKSEIRAAFEPQFDFAFGALRFDEVDRVFDVENRKMTIRYVCRHDISRIKPRGLVGFLLKYVGPLVYGERFGWQGVDVFHFDSNGKIKEKYTYAWYGYRMHFQRELG